MKSRMKDMRSLRSAPARGARRFPAVLIAVALLAVSGVLARDPRSVFTSVSSDLNDAKKKSVAEHPIQFVTSWSFDGFGAPLAGDLSASDQMVVGTDTHGRMAAVDGRDGHALWSAELGAGATVGPFLDGNAVYQATDDGMLNALRASDGSTLWHSPVGAAPAAPPVRIGVRLLQATREPALVSFNPATGEEVGRRPLPGQPLLPVRAALKHATGAVVVTDHGMVLLLDTATLEVIWRHYVRQAVTAPPLVIAHHVYLATADHALRCLKLSSGRPTWTQRMGSKVTAKLLERDGMIYALCFDNDIYVIDERHGHLVTRVALDHRLAQDAALAATRIYVAPYTAASLVGLELPGLAEAGRFQLEAEGEWFTTSPVVSAERVALGWGRDSGRVIGLEVKDAPKPKGGGAGTKPQPPASAAKPSALPPKP
jgi:outer membrane protein assembly factor BamB